MSSPLVSPRGEPQLGISLSDIKQLEVKDCSYFQGIKEGDQKCSHYCTLILANGKRTPQILLDNYDISILISHLGSGVKALNDTSHFNETTFLTKPSAEKLANIVKKISNELKTHSQPTSPRFPSSLIYHHLQQPINPLITPSTPKTPSRVSSRNPSFSDLPKLDQEDSHLILSKTGLPVYSTPPRHRDRTLDRSHLTSHLDDLNRKDTDLTAQDQRTNETKSQETLQWPTEPRT